MLSDQQRAFASMLEGLFRWAGVHGYTLRLGDAYRSTDSLNCPGCGVAHTYQELLFFNHRSKIQNAAQDPHSNRLAIDLIVERADATPMTITDYDTIGGFWENQGGRWGGRFGVDPANYETELGWDPGHFELKQV